jgi:hypothetical protein
MKIIIGSGERTSMIDFVVDELHRHDFEVRLVGPLVDEEARMRKAFTQDISFKSSRVGRSTSADMRNEKFRVDYRNNQKLSSVPDKNRSD